MDMETKQRTEKDVEDKHIPPKATEKKIVTPATQVNKEMKSTNFGTLPSTKESLMDPEMTDGSGPQLMTSEEKFLQTAITSPLLQNI
jgi:hypothetical protein